MLNYPEAYIAYLVEFHATRDFFECHELLEHYWKEHPSDGRGETWVGLIQLAVGQYHERRGNLRGASKMYGQAIHRLGAARLDLLGIDKESLMAQLDCRLKIAGGGCIQYEDIQIHISDLHLLKLCELLCESRGLVWGSESPYHNDHIIHRHKLRDRSEVITAREAALQAKREGNGR